MGKYIAGEICRICYNREKYLDMDSRDVHIFKYISPLRFVFSKYLCCDFYHRSRGKNACGESGRFITSAKPFMMIQVWKLNRWKNKKLLIKTIIYLKRVKIIEVWRSCECECCECEVLWGKGRWNLNTYLEGKEKWY